MEHWVENLLLELNRISRMAVIEEAYETEKMLCDYSKILNYRLSKMDQTVTIRMELDIIKMLFTLYKKKWNDIFTFDIHIDFNTNSVFIPHYSILSYLSFTLEQFEKMTLPSLHITCSTKRVENTISIQLILQGPIAFTRLKTFIENDTLQEYDAISLARLRWIRAFGESSIVVEAKDNEYLVISFFAFEEA